MVHFIITADTGSGSIHQKKVANSMLQLTKQFNDIYCAFLLGDNIYPYGCFNIKNKQFKTKFEDIYKKIKLPFYLCLGNHDYGLSYHLSKKDLLRDNSLIQIEYSKHSKKWNMPAKYYNVIKPPCEYFMIDTNFDVLNKNDIQKQFISVQKMLQNSKQPWKILCGHHTFRSIGEHGNANKTFERFMKDLLKPKNCNIDFYICGHDHCKSLIQTYVNKKPFHCLVIGTGGGDIDETKFSLNKLKKAKTKSKLLFHSKNYGTCLLKATPSKLSLKCFNEELDEEYSFELSK